VLTCRDWTANEAQESHEIDRSNPGFYGLDEVAMLDSDLLVLSHTPGIRHIRYRWAVLVAGSYCGDSEWQAELSLSCFNARMPPRDVL